MRVSQTQRAATPAGKAARRTGGGGGVFQPSSATAPRKSAPARGSAAVSSLDAIVALQTVDDPGERRKRAIRDASETLDVLDELKIGLLSGRVSPDRLARLKALLREGGDAAAEPELEELLRGIDLRARVELAKLAKRAPRTG